MRPLPALLAVVAVALAGCVAPPGPGNGGGPDGPSVASDWVVQALNNSLGHNHSRPDHHDGISTPNFRTVGWNPLQTDYHDRTTGGYMCGDTANRGDRRIAVTHSFTSDVAAVVVDVTDPTDPQKIGELVLQNVHVYDVAVTSDASHVVLATSQSGSGEGEDTPGGRGVEGDTATIRPVFVDNCGNRYQGPEEQAPYRSGLVLVDLADPAQPTVTDYRSQPTLGAHSAFATEIDGVEYVLGATTNLEHRTSYFSFFTIESTPDGPRFLEYGVYDAQYPGPDGQAPLVNGHVDGWIQRHPVTGEILGYLANWNGGMIVVRLADRGQIQTVGRWNNFQTEEGPEGVGPGGLDLSRRHGQIHGTLPMDTVWNGTHYTFAGQEVVAPPPDLPTGQVFMLNTTNPSDPSVVARWTLPEEVEWGDVGNESLLFSTHYFDIVDRTMYISMYHGGVWAVDVRPSQAPHLPTLGVFSPDRVSPKPPGDLVGDFDWTPTVLEVRSLDDGNGTLSVFDSTSGIYNVRFDRSVDVPVSEPWTRDGWSPGG